MRICIFLTNNLSLLDWKKSKIFDREIYMFSKRKNIHYTFISYGDLDESKFLKEFKNLEVYNIKKLKFKNQFILRFFQPIYSLIFDKKLINLIKNCDLLTSNQMDGALMPSIFSLILNRKFILRTGYSLSFFQSKSLKINYIKKFFLYLYELICISTSYRYTISSKYEYEIIKNKFPFFIHKTFIIPNFINTNIFKPYSKKSEDLSLISIGRLDHQKNPFDLILISKLSNLPLTIVGEGKLKHLLLDFIKKIKAPVKIIPKVSNSELPTLLNSHHIYISTSLYEGCPKAILEAMSCGLITIAYSAPGVDEIILNKKNGFITNRSPYYVNNVLTKILKNKTQFDNIKNEARKYILENNSIEKIMNLQNQIYFN